MIAPIFVSAGSIEYEFVELTSRALVDYSRLIARTSRNLNW